MHSVILPRYRVVRSHEIASACANSVQAYASLPHLGQSTFFEVYGQKLSKFFQFSTMGEDSPPPTPTSEVRGREKSSKEDKNTTEVLKSVATSAPQKGGKKSLAPKDSASEGSSTLPLNAAARLNWLRYC